MIIRSVKTRSNVDYLYMIRRLRLYRHCEALKTRSNVVTLFIHDKKVERYRHHLGQGTML